MLAQAEIRKLIETKGLVSGYRDMDTQIQPNGFDLTICELRMVAKESPGIIDFDNSTRRIPDHHVFAPSAGKWYLYPGIAYVGLLAETITLPLDVAALSFARSSLVRCGVHVSNAVWDKGYSGRGSVGLSTRSTVILTEGARILQMVFFRTDNDGSGYNGVFQGEK